MRKEEEEVMRRRRGRIICCFIHDEYSCLLNNKPHSLILREKKLL
jgi:hypothetical protein